MDPNSNPQEPVDNSHSFDSNPPAWQDPAPRFQARGHNQGLYPTFNPRMRPYGNFSQRGRYAYNKRGGSYRPQNRAKTYDQQSDQSFDNTGSQTTNPPNRHFNRYFRTSMLEDPWANMKPEKVPSNGTSLVSDPTAH